MTVAIVDYGMGNLGSVSRALVELGAKSAIAREPGQLAAADRMILPGVGNFGEAMKSLAGAGWVEAIRAQVEAGKPLLGICLGMQLLASTGTEGGTRDGLGLIPGQVVRLDMLGCELRIPHMGWNEIMVSGDTPLFAGIPQRTDFYFVHSYAFRPANSNCVLARTVYGVPVVAAVGQRHIFGTQFHPEKSSKAGVRVLKNFLDHAA